jgi:hypothetical protein
MMKSASMGMFIAVIAATVLFCREGFALDAPPAMPAAAGAKAQHDGQRDFDYLLGTWDIHLKKRLRPLTGSNEWVEFDGKATCRSIWDGKAEVDEFAVDSPQTGIRIQGLATRIYNPTTHQWSIYWASSKNAAMDALPQVGQFQDGQGEFYGIDTLDGRAIYVRFIWTNTTSAAPHFEQSFSADGGKTWEVNWITEQKRVTKKVD